MYDLTISAKKKNDAMIKAFVILEILSKKIKYLKIVIRMVGMEKNKPINKGKKTEIGDNKRCFS
jgi:16S rRNA G527 N7-methylase RsmG